MTAAGTQRKLDPNQGGESARLLIQQFSRKIVGQEDATRVLVNMLEYHQAGFGDPSMPVGTALFLGPTGTGKTHVVQSFAEALFGSKKACLRIDCAEFQHSHEIAKLIGSPPGYLGHRETNPALTQEALNKFHTDTLKLSVVLFDEIEKASDSLWSLMLGIMDNASLTLGDNRKVDFSKAIILMTSNVGAREMSKKNLGFTEPSEEFDKTKLERIAMSAAKSKFSPEFMNRIQNFVTFNTLTEEQINQVLEIELMGLRDSLLRIDNGKLERRFNIVLSPKAKKRLITEGYNKEYGARHLKRAITMLVHRPLANLVNSRQVLNGDLIVVDDAGGTSMEFYTHSGGAQ